MSDEASNMERRTLTLLVPALRLMAAVRLACDVRKLIIAALGILALQAGWTVCDWLFPPTSEVTPKLLTEIFKLGWDRYLPLAPAQAAATLALWVSEPMRLLTTPLWALLDPASSWPTILHAILALLWMIAVWSLFGCAIARIAVVQVARRQQTGITAAVRFAARRASSLVVAPLCPLLGIGFCAMLLAGIGAFARIPAVGPVLVGIGFIVPITIGFVIALLLFSFVAAWPLMPAAIAAGAEDALDALSRTFGYVRQRTGPFVAMVACAALLGAISLFFVDFFVVVLIRTMIAGLALTNPSAASPFASAGWWIAAPAGSVWYRLVGLLAHGWAYSFFWSAAGCIYLWLRHDIDGTPWNELEVTFASAPAVPQPAAPGSPAVGNSTLA